VADVAAYRYTADSGTTYQVLLPSAFALAMGYTPASGNEPYLSQLISPRYASYVCTVPPMFRQVVIPTRQQFMAPPDAVTAEGHVWRLARLVGEQQFSPYGGNVILASGPPGDKGEKGDSPTFDCWSVTLANDVTLTNAAFTDLLTTPVLPIGRYLVSASLTVLTVTAGRVDVDLYNNLSLGARTVSDTIPASSWRTLTVNTVMDLTSALAIKMRAFSTVTNTAAKKLSGQTPAYNASTGLIVTRLH